MATRAELAPEAASLAELEALGLCDCGQPLDGHPPLAQPKPWAHGRPCARTAVERGIGWDGRTAPTHTEAERRRWSEAQVIARQLAVRPREAS